MTTHRPHMPGSAGPGSHEGIADQFHTASGRPSRRDIRDARLAYLGIPLAGFIPPLWVYLASGRRSAFARRHAAEALRVSFAAVIYGVCVLIIAAMLALDSVKIAVAVVGPLALALWLVIVVLVIRAARAASQGRMLKFPGWLRISPRK
jgi:uncharacterized protein